MLALRTLEFDRIVEVVTGLALTPLGAAALAALEPETDPKAVGMALNATSETTAYLRDQSAVSRCAPAAARGRAGRSRRVEGRPLDPLPLRSVADFLDSVELARSADPPGRGFVSDPHRHRRARRRASNRRSPAVRRAIDPAGEVLDTPARRCERFAIGCGRSANGCARPSNSSFAARTRRSTCRSR